MTMWTPSLTSDASPRYRAIADQLARDIASGSLAAGARLPTHRALATQIGVTVGTVSRAYAEAERLGLISGEVGRGTFVREQPLSETPFDIPDAERRAVYRRWVALEAPSGSRISTEVLIGIVAGLAEIGGRSTIVVASDNKVLAGAWIPGQADKVFRAQDMAERLNLPLIWVLNCSGIKLTQQEALYSGRRSGGRSFFRHAELNLQGVPVLAAVFGSNPAGGISVQGSVA